MSGRWAKTTLYMPGDVVVPETQQAQLTSDIPNSGFEDGDSAWNKTGGMAIVQEAGSFAGDWHAKFVYAGGASGSVAMATPVAVKPGQSVTASCMIKASGPDQTGGDINLIWLDASDAILRSDQGNEINSSNGTSWKKSSVTAIAPSGAAKVYIQGDAFALNAGGVVRFDNFAWNLLAQSATTGLAYRAVQPLQGLSGSVEPAWPGVIGQTVQDNEVTWEAISAEYVTWEAHPLYKSGSAEPEWPTDVGGTVADGTIAWVASSRYVEQAPRSKIVWRGASKIFAGDGDIIPYSATANPLDWTSEKDAGYLPFGMNPFGDLPVMALGGYRGNLVAFSANGFQMWQIDEDPASMTRLDALPIGSVHHHALCPVNNDLLFLTRLGVRSMGIAGASTNLKAGDVGMPVDPLIQEAMRVAEANGNTPLASYNPAAGQYMLAFRDYPPMAPAVLGDLPDGNIGSSGTMQYAASGGVMPYTFEIVAGALPPGASMDANGLVTYEYTTPGGYSWTVQITDSDGVTDTFDDSATIAGSMVVAGDLPSGSVGSSGTLQYAASGGIGPYSYSVIAGELPAGASIGADGLVTYSYTTIGSYSWTIQAMDSVGNTATIADSADVSTEVGPWDAATKSSLVNLSNNDFDATFTGDVGNFESVYGKTGKAGSGKWQFEVEIISDFSLQGCGIADKTNTANILAGYPGQAGAMQESVGRHSNDINVNVSSEGAISGTSSNWEYAGHVATLALNLDVSPPTLTFWINGVQEKTITLPPGKTWYPVGAAHSNSVLRLRVRNLEFPVAGFSEWGS